MTNNLKL